MSKYKVVFRMDGLEGSAARPFWEIGCPLFFDAVQVSRDVDSGAAYLQARVLNVSGSLASSFSAQFHIQYEDGSTEDLESNALDADIAPSGKYTLQPREMRQGDVKLVQPRIVKANISGTSWTAKSEPKMVQRSARLSLSEAALSERAKLLKEAGCVTPETAAPFALEYNDGWTLCPCGQPSLYSAETCPRCHLRFNEIDYRYQSESELTNLAQIRGEREIAEERKRLKAIKAGLVFTCLVAGFAFVAGWLYPEVISPGMDYANAGRLVESNQLEDAYEIYRDLGSFKDSQQKLEQTRQAIISDGKVQIASCISSTKYSQALVDIQYLEDHYVLEDENDNELRNLYWLATAGVSYNTKDYEGGVSALGNMDMTSKELGVELGEGPSLSDKLLTERAIEVFDGGDAEEANELITQINIKDDRIADIENQINNFINRYGIWFGTWEEDVDFTQKTYYIGMKNFDGLNLYVEIEDGADDEIYLVGYSEEKDYGDRPLFAWFRELVVLDDKTLSLGGNNDWNDLLILNEDGTIDFISRREFDSPFNEKLVRISEQTSEKPF